MNKILEQYGPIGGGLFFGLILYIFRVNWIDNPSLIHVVQIVIALTACIFLLLFLTVFALAVRRQFSNSCPAVKTWRQNAQTVSYQRFWYRHVVGQCQRNPAVSGKLSYTWIYDHIFGVWAFLGVLFVLYSLRSVYFMVSFLLMPERKPEGLYHS